MRRKKVKWGGRHHILVWHCRCAFDKKKECKFAFCKFCVMDIEEKGEGGEDEGMARRSGSARV